MDFHIFPVSTPARQDPKTREGAAALWRPFSYQERADGQENLEQAKGGKATPFVSVFSMNRIGANALVLSSLKGLWDGASWGSVDVSRGPPRQLMI